MKASTSIGLFGAFLAVGLAMSGCRQPLDFVSILDGATGVPLAMSPTTASVLFDEELTLEASGGSPPYVFSIHGDSADLGSIDPETGVFRAPAVEVAVTARVTDADGNTADARIQIRRPDGYSVLSVSPSSASSVTGNSVTFTLSGGTPPYTAAVTTGESGAAVPTVDAADPSKWRYTAGSAAGEDVIEFRDSASPQNSITVTVSVSTPDLVVDYEVVSVSHVMGTAGGGTVEGEFSIRNAGVAAGTSSVSYTAYASTDHLLSFGDTELESGTTVALSAGASSAPITFSGTLPQYSGNYYLLVVLSSSDDSVIGNNLGATTSSFAVTGDPSPDIDYTVSSISAGDLAPGAGSAIGETFVISNVGTADGSEKVHWSAYVSSNATYEFGDPIVASGSIDRLLAGMSSSAISIGGTWPTTSGSYYLIIQVSAGDEAAGTGSNDVVASTSAYVVQPPDVDYRVVTAPTNSTPTILEPIAETFGIENTGVDAGAHIVYWTVYMSAGDDTLDAADTVVDAGSIGPLTGTTVSSAIPIDARWPEDSGASYHLIFTISAVDDVNDANDVYPNVAQGPTAAFVLQPLDIDYQVDSFNPPPGPATGESSFTGTFRINNTGADAGSESVYWTAYLSTDGDLTDGTGDWQFDGGSVSPPAAGGSSGDIAFDGAWPSPSGSYYVIVHVTSADELDPVTGNTAAGAAVTVTGIQPTVDYAVTSVTHTGGTTGGGAFTGEFTFGNVGTHGGTAPVDWKVLVSTDSVASFEDIVADTGSSAGMQPADPDATVAFAGTWPASDGTYYLIVVLSSLDDKNDANNGANSGSIAVSGTPPPDYGFATFSPPSGPVLVNETFSGTFEIINNGTTDGQETVSWTGYLSDDGVLDGTGEWQFDGGTLAPLISGGGSAVITFDGRWPGVAGTYYLIIELGAADETGAALNDNAASSVGIPAEDPFVDYEVGPVLHTGGTTGGQGFTGEFTVSNIGTGDGTVDFTWRAVVSTDSVASFDDIEVDAGVGASMLAAAPAATIPFTGTWPAADGTYYLVVVVSSTEDDADGNNVGATGSIAVSGTPPPDVDYVVHSLTAGGTPTVAGSSINEQLVIRNQGAADGTDLFTWAAYYSKGDSTLDAIERDNNLLDAGQLSGLPSGADSGIIAVNGSWPDGSGTYYLIVELTSTEDSAAANDGNNTEFSGGFDVQPPDVNYDVTAVSAPGAPVEPGSAASASFEFDNIGVNDGSSSVYWTAYVSRKSYLDGSTEAPFDSGSVAGLPGSSASGAIAMNGTWPSVPNTYYLIVVLSASEDNDSSNNAGAGPAFQVVSPAVVDYIAGGLSLSQSVAPIDSTATEQFYIQNIGEADGTDTIQWTAYLSTDTVLDPVASGGTDVWLDSGSRTALTAGSMHASVYISGTWSASSSGHYHVIVSVSATDDAAPSNDVLVSDATIELYDPPDYALIGPTLTEEPFHYGGYVGQLLSNTTPTPAPSEYEFSITKFTGDKGKSLVTYGAAYSSDGTFSPDDTVIAENTVDPFESGGEPAPLAFDSPLPATPGQYYIILYVSAEDDRSEGNNYIVGGPLDVASGDGSWVFAESDYTDDSAVTADDFYMRLNVGETMTVNGTLDDIIAEVPSDDYFVVRTGHDVTKLSIYSTWAAPDEDCMDLGVFNTDLEIIGASAQINVGREPEDASGTFDVQVTPNTTYYILAQTWAFQFSYSQRDPYELYVTGGTWP